ncbi:MAG: Inner membrane protein YjgN [Syntrophorhabdus sp. PtaB.Bin006]|nr:MAG: Inner membrane protein YjgN [Syntrophorhabdus sp. PtaB.Bin006]
MSRMTCAGCGFIVDVPDLGGDNQTCPQCGGQLMRDRLPVVNHGGSGALLGEGNVSTPGEDIYDFEFTGTAQEYFRIWIVNAFLTIVTLGIYAAWARVRTRQYFYGNTRLAGHPFYFMGQPLAILKGNLIIGAGLICYFLVKGFNPFYATMLFALFYGILPLLIYKSLKFNARYSAFRNIRFRFLGTLGESYGAYLLVPCLIPFTLGLIIPYWEFRRKRYFFGNLAFGTSRNTFTGRPGAFYRTYGAVILMVIGAVVGIGILGGLLSSLFAGSCSYLGVFSSLFKVIPIWISIVSIAGFVFFRQYLYAKVNNYCWNHVNIGGAKIQSTLKVGPMTWIYLTNMMAIILSLGLLIPWAKIRRTRYLIEHLAVMAEDKLQGFAAGAEQDVDALGDAATDFFDIGFGL